MGEQPIDHSMHNTSTNTERAGTSRLRMRAGGIVLFIALMTVVSACTGSSSEEPKSSSSKEPVVSMDDQYIGLVRSETTTLGAVSDAALITLAEETCTALDDGATLLELVAIAMDEMNTETKSDDAIRTIGFGISAYCPQHGDGL